MNRLQFLGLFFLPWWIHTMLVAVIPAAALQAPAQLYLSIEPAAGTPRSAAVVRTLCADLQEALHQASAVRYSTRCEGTRHDQTDISAARVEGRYQYHIAWVRGAGHTAWLAIENWQQRPDETFERAKWRLSGDSEVTVRTALQQVLAAFLTYQAEPHTLPESLLLHSISHAELVALKAGALEVDEASLAQSVFDADWQRYQDEFIRPRHFWRATSEVAVLLGMGTTLFWLSQANSEGGFDLDPTLESLGKKLSGEAIRLDANSFYTNAFNHPFAGAGYYSVARSNGYGPLGSFLFSLAGSSMWELVGEYLEFFSINDQIFTPVGGTVIGEVFYQLGEFFTTSAPNTTNSALKWVFGGFQNFHRRLDGTPVVRTAPTDTFGFRNDIWHRFDLFGGAGVAADSYIVENGFETQIIHLPGYGTRLGDISAWLPSTVFTQMRFNFSISDDGLQDLSLFLKAMFVGYFRQHLTPSQNGTVRGYSLLIGPASAYELSTHDWNTTGIEDTYGIVNVLGPSMDLTSYHGSLRLRLTLAFFGDFAAIRAFAIDAFKQVGSLEGARSVLRDHNYYFALGLTAHARATLQYHRLEWGARWRHSYYDSIDSLASNRDDIVNDVETTDTIVSVRTWITYEFIRSVMQVAFAYERRWRSGTASDGNVSASQSETEDRFTSSLQFSF